MSVVIPSLRGAIAVPGWAKNDLWRRARAVPSLDLRFADNKSLVDATTGSNLVTFTRASSGTYVDSTGVIQTAATNAPRFDHDPTTGESLGLLVEEQRTNLLIWSEEFDDAAWTPIGLLAFGSGSTANAIASPNGQITADLLTESTTTGTHQVQQTASVTIGQVYTYSVFCKLGPNAVRRIQLLVTNANFTVTPIATFDLTTGTVVSAVQGTASITSYANGWYRLALNTIAATSTGVNGFHFRLVDTGTNNSYTGDGSAGLYLWGAQLEAGAFPTSYIPTTTAAVTRSADVAGITGSNFSSWASSGKGTIYGESIGSGPLMTLRSVASANNRVQFVIGASAVVFNASIVASSSNTTAVKRVMAYELNNTNWAYDGSLAFLDNSCTIPIVEYATIGYVDFGGALRNNGTISRLTFWPTRLPDSTLQTLTQ
jgi:hypothetical protein